MPPVLMDREPWTLVVIVVLTAVCGVVAVRAEQAGAHPGGSDGKDRFQVLLGRVGWPLAAALVGAAAYAAVLAMLMDLHLPDSSGTEITVAGFGASGLLASALLVTGLLVAALPSPPRTAVRWQLPVVAVVSCEALLVSGPFTMPQGRTPMDLVVGGTSGLVLALLAWWGLLWLTRPRAGGAAAGVGVGAAARAGAAAGSGAVPGPGHAFGYTFSAGRWALLLPGLVAMVGDVLGLELWVPASPANGMLVPALAELVVGLLVLAWVGVVVRRWPGPAADFVALALTGVGAYGIAQGAFGRTLVVVGTFGSPGDLMPVLPAGFGHNAAVLGGIQGAMLLALGLWLVPRTVLPDVRRLLGRAPDPALSARVQVLTETRAEAVSTAAAELRRIERDLHDGAQGRLVAIGMNLRVAEGLLAERPQEAAALIVEARHASAAALEELRDLVRGIYPPMLADRGLGEALRALALDLPLPCETEIELPERLDAPVESAVYFAVAEVVTNAVRHAEATGLRIRAELSDGLLRVEVTDDGVGGAAPAAPADPTAGSGLAGVERRLAAFDGILAISSPPGGPTIVVMEVPCP
ncbi:sensor histidine kinase [Streptacidiphilus jiangxiensis]|uniref:histidine kinase n=1 Tax=Streptacidiphilus jiangxiensis TaxID=235985 RepID=A0A1H7KPD1_STRJI|nr:Signal transduction histidine kinase [Streptacidiphilus jiangxiensis]